MLLDMSKRFKALSNQNRLAIFEYLRLNELSCQCSGEGCCVGDIAQQFDLALSTVSHHVKVLKEAGLVKCEQRGQHISCTVNHEAVSQLRDFFSHGERDPFFE